MLFLSVLSHLPLRQCSWMLDLQSTADSCGADAVGQCGCPVVFAGIAPVLMGEYGCRARASLRAEAPALIGRALLRRSLRGQFSSSGLAFLRACARQYCTHVGSWSCRAGTVCELRHRRAHDAASSPAGSRR